MLQESGIMHLRVKIKGAERVAANPPIAHVASQ
jgi:hypothetical protein